MANLLRVLSAAAAKKTIPLTQLSLKCLNTPRQCQQVFTQGLEDEEKKKVLSLCEFLVSPDDNHLIVAVNT